MSVIKEPWPGVHILDAACGSGIKSFILAQVDPNRYVTAPDLNEKVLEMLPRLNKQGCNKPGLFLLRKYTEG